MDMPSWWDYKDRRACLADQNKTAEQEDAWCCRRCCWWQSRDGTEGRCGIPETPATVNCGETRPTDLCEQWARRQNVRHQIGPFAIVHEDTSWGCIHSATGMVVAWFNRWPQAKGCAERLQHIEGWSFTDPATDQAKVTIEQARIELVGYRLELRKED